MPEWRSGARQSFRLAGHRKIWLGIAKLGYLSADITPHVLRHGFASLAANLGYNDYRKLARTQDPQHHQRYGHSADAVANATHEADGLGTERGFAPFRCSNGHSGASLDGCLGEVHRYRQFWVPRGSRAVNHRMLRDGGGEEDRTSVELLGHQSH